MKTKNTHRTSKGGRGKPVGAAKSAARRKAADATPGILTLLNIKSILVPIDFSPESEKALSYAVPFARHFGGKLTLVHVVEPIPSPDFVSAFPLTMENEQQTGYCQDHLARVIADLKIEPDLVEKTLVRYGRAFHEIADAARTLKADLVIISTHGYTGLKHALLGSTTERVVQHAPCPVLVVRPNEHEFVTHQPEPTN